MSLDKPLSRRVQVPFEQSGRRLDQVAHELFPEFSRARLQSWLKQGQLTLNDRTGKPKDKVRGGEWMVLCAEEEVQGEWVAEPIPLEAIFEDEHILIINKTPNLVVHPAAGHATGTLLNGLLHRWPELRHIPRCGIVHRLDKDTSGLMVVAKTLQSQASLVAQLQARTVSRQYFALVQGPCPAYGQVDAAIGRDPKDRKKMAVVASGKPAITDYRRVSSFEGGACVRLKLHTGRTHQIRVHMAHIGHPLVGDPAYGKRLSKSLVPHRDQRETMEQFPRQALHAFQLGLQHPENGNEVHWQVGLPSDVLTLIEACQGAKTPDVDQVLASPWRPL